MKSNSAISFSNMNFCAKRQSNIRLTWEAELARILPNEAYSRSDSKMRDKPLTQVEAIVSQNELALTKMVYQLQSHHHLIYSLFYLHILIEHF